MAGTPAGLVTVLVTDLVGSTALLQEAGDERGQRMFRAHRKLLQDAVAAAGGRDFKWTGDGIIAVFHSAADAVRCGINMQQAAQRPVAGERLGIRVGLHCGEVTKEGSDYFGPTVDIADGICNAGDGGQILCSAFVTGLLFGRQAFSFRDFGPLQVKGSSTPIEACEVVYEIDRPSALLSHPPFLGREAEQAQLEQALKDARAGAGKLVMLVGEPGIGKSRLADELMDFARDEGVLVLSGACYEGDWTLPYGPFADLSSPLSAQRRTEILTSCARCCRTSSRPDASSGMVSGRSTAPRSMTWASRKASARSSAGGCRAFQPMPTSSLAPRPHSAARFHSI